MNELDKSLSRISQALRAPAAAPERKPAPKAPAAQGPGPYAASLGVAAVALFAIALLTGHPGLIALAIVFAALGGGLYLLPQASRLYTLLQGGPPDATHASIGMGAEVADGAVVEPGASVEMGATVGYDAVVRSGAVVRMGATVGPQAVLERGAVVSWGAEVKRGAVVGEDAVVGAGATVRERAQVPSGMRISPGSTYAAKAAASKPLPAAAPTAPKDPRDQRLAAVCDKLDAELKAAPEHVRAFLGASDQTIVALRRACEDLSIRERAMREEADPQALARLDAERAALDKRLAEEADPQLQTSLRGAAAAIDDLKRQRGLLRLGADRLEAEHARLLYTMEGLASQFVRLRTAGAGAPTPELETTLQQLRAGIDAIADALEEVSRQAPAAMRELAVPPPDSGGAESAPAEGLDIRRGSRHQ